jgi:hypothetical protein
MFCLKGVTVRYFKCCCSNEIDGTNAAQARTLSNNASQKTVACSIKHPTIQWITRRRALSTKPLEMRVLLDALTILNP